MLTIYKYELRCDHGATQSFSIPEQHKVLSVQMQHGKVCVWILVNLKTPLTTLKFHVFGTGHEIETVLGLDYLDTVQEGPYVWHIFYTKRGEQT
jgi:hypothetical protein